MTTTPALYRVKEVRIDKTEDNHKPVLVGGFGEKCFGKQYRQGDRVYDSNAVAMAVLASSVGGAGCHSYLYLVDLKEKKNEASRKHRNTQRL